MAATVPVDSGISIAELTKDPYPIYRRLRAQSPVTYVESVKRIFLTKAEDTRLVKDNPDIFSSNDPNTPMKRAFLAHTLMRKDGQEHRTERVAMMPTFNPGVIRDHWVPLYEQLAKQYMERLPPNETVDLFEHLAAPLAARFLAEMMGLSDATDQQMQVWSQVLIDGAGNFGWRDAPFAASDKANAEMDECLERNAELKRANPDHTALSVMVNADKPIPWSQIVSNVKIAIGGGINEPRDALLTILYGLLSNPDQLAEVRANAMWDAAFEEGVRWVAPIQVSSRLVMQDTEIRGHHIPHGETVMTIQASANRDEDLLDNGEQYDALRGKCKHQAFGNGPHTCMGSRVSRLTTGAILLPMLFETFPGLALPEPEKVPWNGFGFRGPIQLPVTLGTTGT